MEELSFFFLLGWLFSRASNWLLRPVRSASEVTVAWLNVEQSATEAKSLVDYLELRKMVKVACFQATALDAHVVVAAVLSCR